MDSRVESAIAQIKEKEYINSLGKYSGEVLLVGISYDSKTLKHSSAVERINIRK